MSTSLSEHALHKIASQLKFVSSDSDLVDKVASMLKEPKVCFPLEKSLT
jgi:hypothetical protein